MALVGKVRMNAGRDAMVRKEKGGCHLFTTSTVQSSPVQASYSFVIRVHDA